MGDATRGNTGNDGGGREQVQAPTPARRDHPSAIPDRSCPAPPRRFPSIVAVPLADQLGVGLMMLINTHPRRTTRDAPPDRAESMNKVGMARRVPPPSAPTPHYDLGLQMSRDISRQLIMRYATLSELSRCLGLSFLPFKRENCRETTVEPCLPLVSTDMTPKNQTSGNHLDRFV